MTRVPGSTKYSTQFGNYNIGTAVNNSSNGTLHSQVPAADKHSNL